MTKLKIVLLSLFFILLGNLNAKGQWLVGPAGGVSFTDIVMENINVQTEYGVNPVAGILITYLPENNKPGVKLLFSRMQYGFYEKTNTDPIHYKNSGINFQFLSYLYFPIKKFRVSIEAGPGISYFNNPVILPNQNNSVLPDFSFNNINKMMLDLEGGIGFAQPIGKFHISAHSTFAFSTSKIFKNYLGYSNPLSIQAWFGVQYEVFQHPKKQTQF